MAGRKKGEEMSDDWMGLNLQQNFNGRLQYVKIMDNSRIRVGKNILMNRLSIISNEFSYSWLNLSKDSFKIRWEKPDLELTKIKLNRTTWHAKARIE